MKSEIVKPSVWLNNFHKLVSSMIQKNKKDGYSVKAVMMTIGIYEKYIEKIGYEVDEILGYNIEIAEQTEDQFEVEGEMVFIRGDALN